LIKVVVDYDPTRREIVAVHLFLAHEEKEAELCRAGLTRDHPKRKISLITSSCLREAKRKHAQLVAEDQP